MPNARAIRRIAIVVMLLTCAPTMATQTWTSQPIKLVVPASPGGSMDQMVRALATVMHQQTDHVFIVENRAGGAGMPAREHVANAPPDGTVVLLGSAHELSRKAYSPETLRPLLGTDFTPVAKFASMPNLVVVNANSTIHDIGALVREARSTSHPGGLNYGVGSLGNVQHLTGIRFAKASQAEMTAVPYKGSAPAIRDLIGGQIDVLFETMPAASAFVQEGQLRALAITSKERSPLLPDVPTLRESGFPDLVVETWYGAFVPAGTPATTVSQVTTALQRALRAPEIKKMWEHWGSAVPPEQTPAQFSAALVEEATRWEVAAQTAQTPKGR